MGKRAQKNVLPFLSRSARCQWSAADDEIVRVAAPAETMITRQCGKSYVRLREIREEKKMRYYGGWGGKKKTLRRHTEGESPDEVVVDSLRNDVLAYVATKILFRRQLIRDKGLGKSVGVESESKGSRGSAVRRLLSARSIFREASADAANSFGDPLSVKINSFLHMINDIEALLTQLWQTMINILIFRRAFCFSARISHSNVDEIFPKAKRNQGRNYFVSGWPKSEVWWSSWITSTVDF